VIKYWSMSVLSHHPGQKTTKENHVQSYAS
jgi:hypothetical protein